MIQVLKPSLYHQILELISHIFLDFSSSNSKPDIKAADRVLPKASINLKNEETSNVASNEISSPSFVKVNSVVPSQEKKNTPISMQILNIEGAI